MSTTTLYPVRHAEPAPQADEADDPGLSSTGRGQADRLGRRFADVPLEAVLHSPQRRAAETAHLLVARLPGTAIACSALLRDVTPVPGSQDSEGYSAWLLQRLRQVPRINATTAARGCTVPWPTSVSCGRCELLLVTHAFVVG